MAFSTTAKHALRWLTGSSAVLDVDAGFQALAEDLDSKIAVDDQGTVRPTSTPGTPGKSGLYFRRSDVRRLSRDHGTGWEEIPIVAEADLAADEGVWWDGTGWVADKVTTGRLATDALNAFLKLNAAADRKVAFGTAVCTGLTGTGSSETDVAHGLGAVPVLVMPVAREGGGQSDLIAHTVQTDGLTTTHFRIRSYYTPGGNVTVTPHIYWLAIA